MTSFGYNVTNGIQGVDGKSGYGNRGGCTDHKTAQGKADHVQTRNVLRPVSYKPLSSAERGSPLFAETTAVLAGAFGRRLFFTQKRKRRQFADSAVDNPREVMLKLAVSVKSIKLRGFW